MISFSEVFAGEPYQRQAEKYWLYEARYERAPDGLAWDWRKVGDNTFDWCLVPAGEAPRLTHHYTAHYNPLAAMCHHKDTHSTERLPQSTAKEAPQGICAVAGFDHRPGAWK